MLEDKNKENFINAGGTGNLDEGENEPVKLPWTDSVSVSSTKITLDKKKKKNQDNFK